MRWKRRRNNLSRFWTTGAASLLVHGLGAYGISTLPVPEIPMVEEEEVLRISVVAMGQPVKDVTPPPAAPPEQPAKPTTKPSSVVTPAPASATPSADQALPASDQPAAQQTQASESSEPQSFAEWREQRMANFMPSEFPTAGAGGDDLASNEGVDRCEPFPGRHLDRLYLLYDSSGSMQGSLGGQALRCAHQYAQAAIDGGADVVVGNFAGTTVLAPPTRNMTDVAMTLRAPNNHNYTFLPSRELYRYFDQRPDAAADLVILSDGYIPNYREVLSSYQYFLELNGHNRAYLYTLGVSGHPEVTAALKKIGFDVYIYRLF